MKFFVPQEITKKPKKSSAPTAQTTKPQNPTEAQRIAAAVQPASPKFGK